MHAAGVPFSYSFAGRRNGARARSSRAVVAAGAKLVFLAALAAGVGLLHSHCGGRQRGKLPYGAWL